MNRSMMVVCAALSFVLATGTAMAADIQGRIGVTGRVGFLAPADSEAFAVPSRLDTDIDLVGGGGLIYGISRNLALELDVTHSGFDAHRGGFREGEFSTTNISMGAQYRFLDARMRKFVPYLGAGVDILLNDFRFYDGYKADIDTVAGAHVSGGTDYFLTQQLALNAEVKGVIAPDADINYAGVKIGHYDPTNLSVTFGVRYFFN